MDKNLIRQIESDLKDLSLSEFNTPKVNFRNANKQVGIWIPNEYHDRWLDLQRRTGGEFSKIAKSILMSTIDAAKP